MPERVVVAGGGLAGLTCALSLGRAGLDVTVCESTPHLGGKANATVRDGFPVPVEHGPHFFAGWYLNTRALLADLGLTGRLVDIDHLHYLLKAGASAGPRDVPVRMSHRSLPALVAAQARNLQRGPLPWDEMLQSALSTFDLATARLDRSRSLDEISVTALLRSRWYATESLARVTQTQVLRGASVAAHLASAASLGQLARLWLRHPLPFMSVLDTDLATGFVDPLAAAVERVASVRRDAAVERVLVEDGRVAGVRLRGGEEVRGDRTVLALPAEATRALLDDDVLAVAPSLGALHNLHVAPMAAVHLAFDRPLPLPSGVVYLWNSPLSLNLIDLRHVWPAAPDGASLLSFVVSDFSPLSSLSDERIVAAVVEELCEFVPAARDATVRASALCRNDDTPMFLPTVGSWRARPRPDGVPHADPGRDTALYATGDYVQTEVDIPCMEAAVVAGLQTAQAICAVNGRAPGMAPRDYDADGRVRALAYRAGKLGCAAGGLVARVRHRGPGLPDHVIEV